MANLMKGAQASPGMISPSSPLPPPPPTPIASDSSGTILASRLSEGTTPMTNASPTTPSKDPYDYTDKFNTRLSAEDEKKFQDWAAKNNRLRDLYDYDIRGWWKNNGKQASNGHMTDEFKKPNHPTFSTGSKYSGRDGLLGGEWGGTDDRPTFKPSATNLKNMSKEQLRAYFKRVEPNAELLIPEGK